MPEIELYSIILIAISLSADCFAVGLAGSISLPKITSYLVLRTGLTFGIFQAGMAFIGWAGGNTFIDYIEPFDHWLAFGLLGFIGGKMVKESFGKEDVEKKSAGLTSIMVLLTLAVATSIDSLAAGLSLAFLKVNIYTAVITIGLTAFIITLLSMYLGKKLNVLVGKRAETAGGIILIGIGVKILLEHLL